MKEFTANRLSNGNRLFPDKVTIEETGITLRSPNLFSGREKTLMYNQINSVETTNPLVGFSSVLFRTRNYETIECKGFTKDETEEMKRLVTMGINGVLNRNTTNFRTGYNSQNDETVNTEIAQLETERLEMEKEKRNRERADLLRQQGRPVHAFVTEYSKQLGYAVLIIAFILIVTFTTHHH